MRRSGSGISASGCSTAARLGRVRRTSDGSAGARGRSLGPRHVAALALVATVPFAAGCGGSASQEDLDSLEARVTALEKTVDQLESETEAARALSGRLDDLESFIQEARDKLSQLDDIRKLLENLGDLIP